MKGNERNTTQKPDSQPAPTPTEYQEEGWYTSKRHAPKECPVCGARPWEGEIVDIYTALRAAYSGFQIYRTKHPFWKFPLWQAHCMNCALREAMMNPTPLWKITYDSPTHSVQIPIKFK
jgi:hypothetical protein